jgi:hypothetical protein
MLTILRDHSQDNTGDFSGGLIRSPSSRTSSREAASPIAYDGRSRPRKSKKEINADCRGKLNDAVNGLRDQLQLPIKTHSAEVVNHAAQALQSVCT